MRKSDSFFWKNADISVTTQTSYWLAVHNPHPHIFLLYTTQGISNHGVVWYLGSNTCCNPKKKDLMQNNNIEKQTNKQRISEGRSGEGRGCLVLKMVCTYLSLNMLFSVKYSNLYRCISHMWPVVALVPRLWGEAWVRMGLACYRIWCDIQIPFLLSFHNLFNTFKNKMHQIIVHAGLANHSECPCC